VSNVRAADLRRLLPGRRDYAGLSRSWRGDVAAGVTVAVVALPLALAFGVASGLGAEAGIVTAIVAGIAAGIFGGSHLQVSGPTGAMTIVLIPVVARFGAPGVLVVGLLAGAILVVAGGLRLGRYAGVLPWPVIEGFTLGIALLIFLQEVPAALGVPKPGGSNTAVVAYRAIHDWIGGSFDALAIVALVIVVMVVLPRLHRSLPASLVAVAIATLAARLADLPVARIGTIPAGLPTPSLPNIDVGRLPELLTAVMAVAALAALESLLSAKVADGLSDSEEHDPDRELVGQGLANIAASLFGGMPATGAIARTAVNVRAGARTRISAIVHGLVLVAVVLALAPLVADIPLAALAGVLTITAVRMVELGTTARIVRSSRGDAALLLTTATATVAFNLVIAVGIGVALAAILALRAMADASAFEREPLSTAIDDAREHALMHEHIVTYRLDGSLFFGAAQRFLLELTAIADVEVVILRLGGLHVLDSTGAQALADLITHLEHRHITVLLTSVRPAHRRLLEHAGALDALAHDTHLSPSIDAALDHAHRHVLRNREFALVGS
jgi:SulP family sulfate permease